MFSQAGKWLHVYLIEAANPILTWIKHVKSNQPNVVSCWLYLLMVDGSHWKKGELEISLCINFYNKLIKVSLYEAEWQCLCLFRCSTDPVWQQKSPTYVREENQGTISCNSLNEFTKSCPKAPQIDKGWFAILFTMFMGQQLVFPPFLNWSDPF
jgi:hypothetical protein